MKQKLLITCALLGVTALTVGEDSLLQRLQNETRKLAVQARAATVEVHVAATRDPHTGLVTWPGHRATKNRAGVYEFVVRGSQLTRRSKRVAGTGVLVGNPPVVVVPHAVAASAKKLQVILPDGSEMGAERVGGDAELGVAVFALPKDTAAKLTGLEPARDWNDLATGTLAVHARGSLGLALVQGADPVLGWLYGGEGQLGGALIGAGGKLLGIGGGLKVASAMSCGQCHAGANTQTDLNLGVTSQRHTLVAVANTQYLNAATGRVVGRRGRASPHARNAYVPGPVIARVVADLKEHGRVRHSYLGVVLGETVGEKGVEITAVLDKSPAQTAGLQKGQKVLSANGVRCQSSAMLSRALAMRAPGDKLTLRVRRGDDTRDVEVTLGDLTEARRELVNESNFGLTCVDLSDQFRTFFGLDADTTGVLVQQVRKSSAAHRAGLRRGDLIFWGGDGNIANLEELRAALAGAKGSLSIRWRRGGQTLTNALRVPTVKRTTR